MIVMLIVVYAILVIAFAAFSKISIHVIHKNISMDFLSDKVIVYYKRTASVIIVLTFLALIIELLTL